MIELHNIAENVELKQYIKNFKDIPYDKALNSLKNYLSKDGDYDEAVDMTKNVITEVSIEDHTKMFSIYTKLISDLLKEDITKHYNFLDFLTAEMSKENEIGVVKKKFEKLKIVQQKIINELEKKEINDDSFVNQIKFYLGEKMELIEKRYVDSYLRIFKLNIEQKGEQDLINYEREIRNILDTEKISPKLKIYSMSEITKAKNNESDRRLIVRVVEIFTKLEKKIRKSGEVLVQEIVQLRGLIEGIKSDSERSKYNKRLENFKQQMEKIS